MYKLGTICTFLPCPMRSLLFHNYQGKYNYYDGINTTIHKCSLPDYVEESIIINTLGDATVNIDSNFSCSYNNIIIRSNNINISNKYISKSSSSIHSIVYFCSVKLINMKNSK